jgi:hypothetical protein
VTQKFKVNIFHQKDVRTISFNRDIIKEKGVTAYFKRAKIKTFPVA